MNRGMKLYYLIKGSYLPTAQCDQMDRLFVNHLAIYSSKNLPNGINNLPTNG